LNANDYVELIWSADSTQVSLGYSAASSSDSNPSTPSAIFTAEQLAYSGPQGYQGYQGNGYDVNSSTTNTIQTGSLSFTVANTQAYASGSRVRVIWTSNSNYWVEGYIYNITGNTISVNVDKTSGSGTYGSWIFSVAGVGSQGATGSQGPIGFQGYQGAIGAQGIAGSNPAKVVTVPNNASKWNLTTSQVTVGDIVRVGSPYKITITNNGDAGGQLQGYSITIGEGDPNIMGEGSDAIIYFPTGSSATTVSQAIVNFFNNYAHGSSGFAFGAELSGSSAIVYLPYQISITSDSTNVHFVPGSGDMFYSYWLVVDTKNLSTDLGYSLISQPGSLVLPNSIITSYSNNDIISPDNVNPYGTYLNVCDNSGNPKFVVDLSGAAASHGYNLYDFNYPSDLTHTSVINKIGGITSFFGSSGYAAFQYDDNLIVTIGGGLALSPRSNVGSHLSAGLIAYDSGHFWGYDGTTWKQLDN
jgi:hypothetical protein